MTYLITVVVDPERDHKRGESIPDDTAILVESDACQ